jgi:methyltransferase (TIGR00027 family)
MEDGRPSITAVVVASLRAHHYVSVPEPRLLDDHLAMQLTGMTSPAEVLARFDAFVDRLAEHCDRSDAAEAIERMMMTVCARSRLMEDQLAASLERGVKQLVILGAGLDSTAYRSFEVTRRLAVFEVDHPATQDWKRKRLAEAGVAIPDNLVFTPFDFERQTLAQALAAGGVRPDEMTFFSWLGVQPYLTDQAVRSTLQTIATFPSGSELVLDLATTSSGQRTTEVEQAGRKVVASLGEPFRSAYAPAVFAAQLRQCGFTQIDMVSVQDWLGRQTGRFNGRFRASAGLAMLVTAKVA